MDGEGFAAFVMLFVVALLGLAAGVAIDAAVIQPPDTDKAVCKALDAKPQGDVCIRDGKVVYNLRK